MRIHKILIFVLIASCFICGGCNKDKLGGNSDGAMQELYNRSTTAKEYADKEFDSYLSRFDSNSKILETSYGFYTAETPVYIVGYKFSNGMDEDLTYAYKISVDDNLGCTILEEGAHVASFLFEEQR